MDHPADVIDGFPDHLKCPICMEVPQFKVLQCRQGHYLCEACYSQITDCPQCRIPFNKENIRNLHVEMMLDKFSMECPYKRDGCNRIITRRSNLDHLDKCFYNTKRFGPLVMVCKMIGFHNCPFKVNKGNTFQFIHHLKHYHWVTTRNMTSMEIEFTNFEDFSGGTKHILFDLPGKRYAFLILITHKPPHGLSWAAFYLRYPKTKSSRTSRDVEPDYPPISYKVECSIKGEPLTWSIFPDNILLMCDAVPEHFCWEEEDIVLAPGKGERGTSPSSLFALINIMKMEDGTGSHQDRHLLESRSPLILTPCSMPAPPPSSGEEEMRPGSSSKTQDALAAVVQKVSSLSLSNKIKGNCHCDKISEHLKCPICGKVPKGKLFQCKEGHLLCDECHPKIGTCAKCHTRLPFTSERIRAMVVETLLDELTLECPYKRNGCNKIMNRKCFQNHIAYCCYNVTRFGPFLSICEGLGLEKCSFKMNRGNANESLHHLQEVHGAAIYDSTSLEIEFADFVNFPGCSTKPLILNRKEDGYSYLVLMTPNGAEGLLTWAVYYLRFPKARHSSSEMETALPPVPHQVECSLNGRYNLVWTASPVDIFSSWINRACLDDSDQMTMDTAACFRSPLASVLVMVKVSKVESQGHDGSRSAHLTLNPYSMPITLRQETTSLPNIDDKTTAVKESIPREVSGSEVVQPEGKRSCPTRKTQYDPTLRSCISCDAMNPKCIEEFSNGLKQFQRIPAPCLSFVSDCPSQMKSREVEPATNKDLLLPVSNSDGSFGNSGNLENCQVMSSIPGLPMTSSSSPFATSPRFDFSSSFTSAKNDIFEFGTGNKVGELKLVGSQPEQLALTSPKCTLPSKIEFSNFTHPVESDRSIFTGPNKGVKCFKKKGTIYIEFQGAPSLSASGSDDSKTENLDKNSESQSKRYLRSRRVVAIKNGPLNELNPTPAMTSFNLKPNCNFSVQARSNGIDCQSSRRE